MVNVWEEILSVMFSMLWGGSHDQLSVTIIPSHYYVPYAQESDIQ